MFEWFRERDIGRKLIAAAEEIAGNGAYGPFEGLEKGEVTVKVIYDGEYLRFVRAPKKPPAVKSGEPFTVITGINDTISLEAPVSRRKRKIEGS